MSVEEVPAQMVAGAAEAVTEGIGFTVTVTVAVPVHPAVVPVTVYVVVVPGETEMLAVLPPVLHEYVVAPVAVRVEDDPAQIVAGEAVAPTTGLGFTVTVTVAVPVQPKLVPVTV